MHRWRRQVASAGWFVVGALGAAAAQGTGGEPIDESRGTEAREMVVLGTVERDGVPTAPFDAVGSRDVLGPEQVKRIGARDLNDLVPYLPGLSTRPYNGGEAAAPNFSIRGLPDDGLTEYILTLIDGVPANPLPYGWTAFSFFPLMTEQVYAIDLIRGGHAVRYSPNTVGGVLNLITPPIPAGPSFDATSTLGENGYASTILSYGDGSGGLGYLFTVGDRRGDGYREDGGFEQRTADVKLRWMGDDSDTWTAARFSYMENEHQAPGGLTLAEFEANRYGNSRPMNRFDGFRWIADFVHHKESSDGHLETFGWVTQTRRELEAQRPQIGVPTDFQRWTDDSYVASVGVRGESRELFGGGHTLYWGARVQQEALPSWKITNEMIGGGGRTTLQDSEYHATALSAHVDDTFRPTEDLSITAGVRAEWVPVTKGEDDQLGGEFDDDFAALLPGVGASYELNDSWVLFGNYHQSFRAPQIWGYDLSAGAPAQDVDFELGDSFELGTRVLGPWGTEGSVTGWRTDFDDVGVFYTGSYENIGRIVAEGVDLALGWELGEVVEELDGLSVQASWTIQDSELREGPNKGNDTPYAWDNKGAWSFQYLTEDDWRLALGGVYVDESFSDEANISAQTPDGTLGLNHSRVVWDAQVERRVMFGSGNLSFAIGATNVFDDDWAVHSRGGYFGGGKVAGPPRQVYVRFGASF